MLKGLTQGQIRDAGWGGSNAQPSGIADAGLQRCAGAPLPAAAAPAPRIAMPVVSALSRRPLAPAVRLIALVLAFFPATASLTKCVPVHREQSVPESHAAVMPIASVVSDSILHFDRWDGHSGRQPDKVPAALRKHSRRPSPSVDDGTAPDPTDDDNTSDDVMGADDTEMVVALWSPPLVSFLFVSETGFVHFCPLTTTPLYLSLQRLRC